MARGANGAPAWFFFLRAHVFSVFFFDSTRRDEAALFASTARLASVGDALWTRVFFVFVFFLTRRRFAA